MPGPLLHTTSNPFAAFAPAPVGVTFESQEEGEEIILLLRQHIIVLLPPLVVAIFFIVFPLIFPFILGFININLSDFLSSIQLFLLAVFWYLIVSAYAIFKFIFWYFNVYILTNERVIDFDFKGILHKQASYAKLLQIQDVSPKMIGFFSTFFNYGDVHIQTAGERQEFEFLKVPRPDEVSQRILEETRREEGETPGVVA